MPNDSHVRAAHGTYRGEPNSDAKFGHYSFADPGPRLDPGQWHYPVLPRLVRPAPADLRWRAEQPKETPWLMKIPAAKGHQPQQATPIPAAYLAMAAAHMQSMGKPVVDPNAPPSQDQLAAAVKAPNAPGN